MPNHLFTRLAGRVGLRLAHEPCRSEDDLYNIALRTDWFNWFGLQHTFRVDLTLLGAPYQNPRFAQLRLKDGVCDAFIKQLGTRPDVQIESPDVRIFAAATPDMASLYIDLAGENLFKRGWRLEKGAAPIKENLAAGIWQTALKNQSDT
ncbi:MAG: hypothetical protein HC848_04815 [Limnobacter sp.]|nr:hypothetical protein [Limnobacter sp.]